MPNQLYIILTIVFGILLILSNIDKILGSASKNNLSNYKLNEALLSSAEKDFYKTFIKYMKDDNIVFSKVRLADIFITKGKGKAFIRAFNRIKAKHVDFIVCDKDTLEPLYAIELDDKSHLTSKVIKRDKFVNGVFSQTGLILVRVKAKREYSDEYLDSLFKIPELMNKVCPKCGAKMVVRVSGKGNTIGEQFFGCSNYPSCKTSISIN